MNFKSIYNPVFLISLQTLLIIYITSSSGLFTGFYPVLIIFPLLVLLCIGIIFSKLLRKRNDYIEFSKITVGVCYFSIAFIGIVNIILFNKLFEFYGSYGELIRLFGDTNVVTVIQRSGRNDINILLIFNYFLPILIVPIAFTRSKLSSGFIILSLIIIFLVSGMYGARILFIDSLLAFILSRTYFTKLSFKSAIIALAIGVIGVVGLINLQALRSDGNNFSKGSQSLLKYYSVSVEQGARIVDRNTTKQPLYWTLRPLFGIPFITNAIGFTQVYEGLFGRLPIKDRQDDFEYVKRIGGDPQYNTLSVYGYSFLDSGVWSVVIITLSYIIIAYIFLLYKNGNMFGLLLFPSIISLTSDQLRTNGIFSSRVVFFVIIAIILILLDGIAKSYERRQN